MKKIILIIFAAFMMTACENDINLKLDDNEDRLTLNALIDCDSINNRIHVSLTGDNSPKAVIGATVEIKVDNNLVETLKTDENGYCVVTYKFMAGQNVRFDVSSPDGKYHVWAEEVVPQQVEQFYGIDTLTIPDKTYYEVDYGYYKRSNKVMRYDISFKDSEDRDFYMLQARYNVMEKFISHNYWGSNDDSIVNVWKHTGYEDLITYEDKTMMEGQTLIPNDEYDAPSFTTLVNKYNAFNDEIINGLKCTLRVYGVLNYSPAHEITDYEEYYDDEGSHKRVKNEQYTSVDMTMMLKTITADEYYYLKALNLMNSELYEDYNSVTGGLKLPTNVNGGAGILGFSMSVARNIHLQGPNHFVDGKWQ